MPSVNVKDLIDTSRISAFQVRVFALCGLVILLDGIDYQVIGIVAPRLIQEFGIPRGDLGWVFAGGPLGAAIGGLSCGLLADRIGRQRMLVATTFLFGAATFATTLIHGFAPLLLLRFVTGLGLGGAVPCCIALTSEYAPARRRAAIVSLLWAAFPLGGMTGGFLNAYLIGFLDWRHLFEIWGAVPMAVALFLLLLPESAQFLIVRRPGDPALRRIVSRLTGASAGAATFTTTEERLSGVPLKHLFQNGRAAGTVPLWFAMFIVLGSLTVLAAWTPVLLTPLGFTSSDAALVIAVHGLGSFLGTACAGRLLERFGVTRVVIPTFVMAGLSVLAYGQAGGSGFTTLAAASFATGIFLGIGSSSVIALAAVTYPTAVRSTGIGWAVAMGRFGSVIGPAGMGFMVGAGAGMAQVFGLLGAVLLIAIPFLWLLGRYTQRRQVLDEAVPFDPALAIGPAGTR